MLIYVWWREECARICVVEGGVCSYMCGGGRSVLVYVVEEVCARICGGGRSVLVYV